MEKADVHGCNSVDLPVFLKYALVTLLKGKVSAK